MDIYKGGAEGEEVEGAQHLTSNPLAAVTKHLVSIHCKPSCGSYRFEMT